MHSLEHARCQWARGCPAPSTPTYGLVPEGNGCHFRHSSLCSFGVDRIVLVGNSQAVGDQRAPNKLAQVAADGISAFIRGNAAFRTSFGIVMVVLAVAGLGATTKVLLSLTLLADRPIPDR